MLHKEEIDQYSIYNFGTKSRHPLSFLEADKESGWHVARNLLKPLNHLSFLEEKEQIAERLHLHSLKTPESIFNFNYELLDSHQKKLVSTDQVINLLAEQLSQNNLDINSSKVTDLLTKYASVAHMEFHPSDLCNLTCQDCTYGHDDEITKPLPVNFPFNSLKYIAKLQPKSMVIIGGGEPTLYLDQKKRFQNLIDEITEQMPRVVLALVTNGTFLPPGDWHKKFSWIRISLDAATPATYTSFRGKNQFKRVIKNYLKYLDFDIAQVGISFLFARSNIHEYAKVAEFIFQLVKREKPHQLHKVNIQYRPLRRDPYKYDKPFTAAITRQQIDSTIKEIMELADSSKEIERFLKEQTNVCAILGGNSHPPMSFKRCYYSQTFKIIRANGDLRPCFIRVTEPDFLLGNINRDSLESIALNTLYIAARKKQHCDSYGCRQCHVNHTFEEGLEGRLLPSKSASVLSDPMY